MSAHVRIKRAHGYTPKIDREPDPRWLDIWTTFKAKDHGGLHGMSQSTSVPERGDSGEFTSDTREEVYEAMPEGEPCIASEITEKTGIPRTTVNYHLNQMADDGEVRKKKFHERRVVWLKPEDSGQ